MRFGLVGTIVLTSAVGSSLTIHILFRAVQPRDDESAVLGAAWVAMPYLVAAVVAVFFRRRAATLVVLLASLLLAAAVGVFLFNASATQLEIARKQAANAVLPGEDPDHGPAAMRQSGAGLAVAGLEATCVFLAVVVPPVQFASIGVAAGIGVAVSYWLRHRAEARQVWELEHTDTRGPGG